MQEKNILKVLMATLSIIVIVIVMLSPFTFIQMVELGQPIGAIAGAIAGFLVSLLPYIVLIYLCWLHLKNHNHT